jgi:hypothetical protein
MARGIHLKTLSTTDLGYLGLPPDLASCEPPDDAGAAPLDASADSLALLLETLDPAALDERALSAAREVRVTLEDVLVLLDEALAGASA